MVSLARIDELRAIGARIAAMLRADDGCFQLQAAVACGLSEKTYYAYLQREGDEYAAFQQEVLPALYEQARRNEETAESAIGSCENGSGPWMTWHKWKLTQRYRKLFGDLAESELHEPPKRHEITGKDGESLTGLSMPELLALLAKTSEDK